LFGRKLMKIQFLGATGSVTGSKYLLRTGTKSILVDCGLFQGFKQLRLRNWASLPVEPRRIHAVILTHAHLDHSGYLPLLIKHGFSGDVYCSRGTRDLCEILLPDSGHLQEEEARLANRLSYSKHHPALPLYTRAEAELALRSLKVVEFGRDIRIGRDFSFRLTPSGHILGAATVRVAADQRKIVFSGDLGRPHDPIMRAPAIIEEADYLVIESTYGDRLHSTADPAVALGDVLNRTFARGGVVVIPAFAVGRTQTILYYIARLKSEGVIPRSVPVYLNSPMAVNATRILHRHQGEHRLTAEQCDSTCNAAHVVSSVEESESLNGRAGPMIIISASGMATGGRVIHHIKAYAPDRRNTILFAGYQAGGTRGAAMVAGAESVKIHGGYVPLRAEVVNLDMLSAHADYAETLDWLAHLKAPPRTTFITHGEPEAADALRRRISERLGWHCQVPEYRESVTLD
jgi:metallo-beta-lactamase family protein